MEEEANGHEDVRTSEQVTHTFESSTAVIKFSGTCSGSDSDSFASDNNDDSDVKDPTCDSPNPDPTNGGAGGKSDLEGADSVTAPKENWKEESWKSDSGFNSDTATNHGVRQEGHHSSNTTQLPVTETRHKGKLPISESIISETASEPTPSIVKQQQHSTSDVPTKETMLTSTIEDSPRRRSSSTGSHRERFNPFNKVPYIDDDHYDSISPFPSVTGTSFPGDRDDFGTPRHENQSTSSDTDTEVSLPSKDLDLAMITNEDLGITEDHFSHPEGCFGFSKVEELEVAIEMCKESVKDTSEHSDQRRELISRLVQLRMKLLELKEGTEEDPDIKLVLGHKFAKRKGKSSNHQCETCNSIIWGMLQSWHRCLECGFSCHSKCLNFVKRQCASTRIPDPGVPGNVSKRGYVMEICPEIGLAGQNYRCAECRTQLSFKGDTMEPRQCDYDGHYYCSLCHWNDTEVIPARVIHNWDFEARKVCRQSKQYLRLMQRKAVLCIQDLNPMLFNYVEELSQIKKLREEVLVMKMYFLSCRKAMEDKLLLQLQDRPHFVDSPDAYSLQDLIDAKDNSLLTALSGVHSNYAVHIRIECPLCQARGFICELCNTDEILYPFDMIATVCTRCSSVFHRDCFYKHDGQCPKCERMSKRSSPDER